jgi:p-cumate 2,3-dioxygenase subunit beta
MHEPSLKESVERFLFDEAELLDQWRFAEWESLLTDDAEYLVPPIGVADGETLSHENTLFVIADDRAMLAARIERMSGKAAYCEMPRSNVRHLVSNVRILASDGNSVTVGANFSVYRVRRAELTQYIGRYRYRLQRAGRSFRIRSKTVLLDIDVLRGQGGLGIIL